MKFEPSEMTLDISGVGIVFYSPSLVSFIDEGDDYLSRNYSDDNGVQSHIQKGDLVGFGTGSPGLFSLSFHEGYPDAELLNRSALKLRLGVRCVDGVLCFRDLYDLMDWTATCPDDQQVKLPSGIYHITLCSNVPPSGLVGDNQEIAVFFAPLSEYPALATSGIPTLYPQ